MWCGTKNDSSMNNPITAVTRSGSSRFMPGPLLGLHPQREPVHAERLEHAADEDGEDHEQLEHVGTLEAADEPRFAREVGAGGVELLADQRVVAGDDEERQLVDVR